MSDCIWRRGADFRVALRDDDGAFDGSEAVACSIKKSRIRGVAPPPETQVAATASVTWSPPAGGEKGYWTFAFSAAQSAGLTAGAYAMDATIVKNGETIATSVVTVDLIHGVTP